MPSHTSTVRVRYAETDQMGVVHHASYLPWFEVARTEYLRGRGLSYKLLEEKGFALPVVNLSVTYMKPAKYDDLLAVTARLFLATPVRFAFEYELKREGSDTPLCKATTEHVAVDATGRPRRIPTDILSILGGPLEKP